MSKGPSVSGEGCSQGGHLFAVASRGGRCKQLSGVSFMRALIPIHDLITIKDPQLLTITLGLGFFFKMCFMCVSVLPARMDVHAWCSWRPEKAI